MVAFFFGGIMTREKVEDETLDINGAAAFLKLSKWTIYQMTRRKEIPCHKPSGGKLVFVKSELKEFLQSGKIQYKKAGLLSG